MFYALLTRNSTAMCLEAVVSMPHCQVIIRTFAFRNNGTKDFLWTADNRSATQYGS